MAVLYGCNGVTGHSVGKPKADGSATGTGSNQPGASADINTTNLPILPKNGAPFDPQAPIISNNGGSVIQGTVSAPAEILSHNGANILSHNGANEVSTTGGDILSHNGANIISNNGGGILSHNGANIREQPLAFTSVSLTDAQGTPVKDEHGKDLVTTTDANGRYSFPIGARGRNLIVRAKVAGDEDLVAFLPKANLASEVVIDVDIATTMSLKYLIATFIKADLEAFEKLPEDLVNEASTSTANALLAGKVPTPENTNSANLVKTAETLRTNDSSVASAVEKIRSIFVVAGIKNSGDGTLAANYDFSAFDGGIDDEQGNTYLFSQVLHTLWKVTPDGISHTLVTGSQWGYGAVLREEPGAPNGYHSGMAKDAAGNIFLCDTLNNRIVKIDNEMKVTVVAGNGQAGSTRSGLPASETLLDHPCGLALVDTRLIFTQAKGNSLQIIDTRRTTSPLTIETILNESTSQKIQLDNPQAVYFTKSGQLLVADSQNNRIVRIVNPFMSSPTIDTIVLAPSPGTNSNTFPVDVCEFNNHLYCITLWGRRIYELRDNLANIQEFDTSSKMHPDRPEFFLAHSPLLRIGTNEGHIFSTDLASKFELTAGVYRYGKDTLNNIIEAVSFCIDNLGNTFVSSDTNYIYKVDAQGQVKSIAGDGQDNFVSMSSNAASDSIGSPSSIIFDQKDGSIIFSNIGQHPSIQSISSTGVLSTIAGKGIDFATAEDLFFTDFKDGDLATETIIDDPKYLAQTSANELLFTEKSVGKILSIDSSGRLRKHGYSDSLHQPGPLTIDSKGNVFITDLYSKSIYQVNGEKLDMFVSRDHLHPAINDSPITGICSSTNGTIYLSTDDKIILIELGKDPRQIAGVGSSYLNEQGGDNSLRNVRNLLVNAVGDLLILQDNVIKQIPRSLLQTL